MFLGANTPECESSRERKFPGYFAPGSESSREREGQGEKGPGSEWAKERKFQGANWPGPIGQFAPGSELARERKGCESSLRRMSKEPAEFCNRVALRMCLCWCQVTLICNLSLLNRCVGYRSTVDLSSPILQITVMCRCPMSDIIIGLTLMDHLFKFNAA